MRLRWNGVEICILWVLEIDLKTVSIKIQQIHETGMHLPILGKVLVVGNLARGISGDRVKRVRDNRYKAFCKIKLVSI
jgi:hypothetical protein